MTHLLIIESPGKKATIQSYLGPTWRVVASMGHIRTLSPSIEFLTHDFEPAYEFMKEKDAAIKALKAAAKDATEIYLGSDKDLEGEAIAYSVCVLLRLNPKSAKRIVFTEVTERAVKAALANPTVIDMARVHAQQARAMLDMMIGFTVSPMLWQTVARGLSAGRCQTPSVRLVLEREEAIAAHCGSTSWGVKGCFSAHGAIVTAVLSQDLDDEESASNYLENVHATPDATVRATVTRPWTESPPPPLITSTLQQQASAKWGWSPKQTMQAAQKLYEAGHITYMRTDQATLSEDAAAAAREWVAENMGREYVATAPPPSLRGHAPPPSLRGHAAPPSLSGLSVQAAHEAIRPTHIETLEVAEYQPLYRLIRQRTLQSVMAAARGDTFTATLQIDEDEFEWKAVTRTTRFEGWKKVGAVAELDEDESREEDEPMVALTKGMRITWTQLRAEPKESKAPPRFTEATLVRELERHGIGRPSTYASLLATIQDRNYVQLRDTPASTHQVTEYTVVPHRLPTSQRVKKTRSAEKSKLHPTDLGRDMWRALLRFEDLFGYGFTAGMEARLDRIARKEEEWKAVLRDTWGMYKDRVQEAGDAKLQQAGDLKPHGDSKPQQADAKVREWSNGVKAVRSKKGPLLLIEGATPADTVFLGWPEGIAWEDMTEEAITAFRATRTPLALGEWNGQPITTHTGKFGTYLKCGDLSLPFVPAEPLQATLARLDAKHAAPPPQTIGAFVIRTGPHGPYLMKQGLKKPQFVSLPKGLHVASLTEKDVEALYRSGLEEKKVRRSRGKTAVKE